MEINRKWSVDKTGLINDYTDALEAAHALSNMLLDLLLTKVGNTGAVVADLIEFEQAVQLTHVTAFIHFMTCKEARAAGAVDAEGNVTVGKGGPDWRCLNNLFSDAQVMDSMDASLSPLVADFLEKLMLENNDL